MSETPAPSPLRRRLDVLDEHGPQHLAVARLHARAARVSAQQAALPNRPL